MATTADAVDPATCAVLHEVRMHHLQLRLDVEMAARSIAGEATLWMARADGFHGRHLKLDVFHLKIHDVAVLVDTSVLPVVVQEEADAATSAAQVVVEGGAVRLPVAKWEIHPFTSFGEILSIELPAQLDAVKTFKLYIRYETDQESPAVCWLEKEQTAGKQHPFMYTQGQEVLNRSFFPCQDSPSVRITYEADVLVPGELVCVMSAQHLGSTSVESDDPFARKKLFQFKMKQSIPVYLVAMAVGDLASADVSARASVWTEPCMLEACKKEFTGILEKYLTIGERLFGEYLWERYDVLVMPPSFPYGGMENPRLTFLSPCIIAGDQSLCSTVAHEISHSWFGNLVTNASWSDFFLNEGFTMYAERRITEEAHGRPLMCLNAKIGEALLKEEISSLGEDAPLTRLRVPLETGIDPGDCYNQCAYEKGYVFVCYLRSLVGSDQIFDKFLRDYTQHFKFQSIPAEDMMAYFLQYFPELADGDDLKAPIKFSTWIHAPGFPQFEPDLSDAKDMMEACESMLYYWQSSYVPVQPNVVYLTMEAKTWPVNQVLYFLDLCVEAKFAHTDVIVELGNTLGLFDSTNTEVLFRWSQVLIKNNMAAKMDFVGNFLTIQGKQKFLIPIYRMLVASSSDAVRQFARDIYDKTRPTIHVMVRDRIEALLRTLP